MYNKQPSDTRINREGIAVKYIIEYTEKDEPINSHYTNLKQFQVKDLEEMLQQMFLLRQHGMHNINVGYNISDSEGWLVEDYCNDTECFMANAVEAKQKKEIKKLEQTIEAQENELALHREFLSQYNSLDMFKKWKEEKEKESLKREAI